MILRNVIVLTLVVFCSKASFGQFAINPKVGVCGDIGPAIGIELNATDNRMIYSYDLMYSSEMEMAGSSKPLEQLSHFGVMAGTYYGNLFKVQLQGGLAPTWGTKRTSLKSTGGVFSGNEYNSYDFFTVGLVMKTGVKINPLKSMGMGIDLQANINYEKPVYMILLSMELGQVRKALKKDS